MTIKTKYDVGATIFFLHDNKVIETIIRCIKIDNKQINAEGFVKQEITYLCKADEPDWAGNITDRVHLKVLEEHAFPSKEELLKSL